MQNLIDLYGNEPLRKMLKDDAPVSIYDDSLRWLEIPERIFIDYVTNRPTLPFDGVPPDKNQYKQEPTFMIAQMHRLWTTTKMIQRYLDKTNKTSVLDLGAFPFALDIILREYIHFNGKINATVNLHIPKHWKNELDDREIDVSYINLDPYVKKDTQIKEMTDHLNFDDNSIDMVVLAHVIEHLYHPLETFKETYRVLRNGGKILISTDNAFRIDTFLNLCFLNEFLHEPVEGTAAMSFHAWRGHCRFFSEKDIRKMLESVGYKFVESKFFEIFYNSFCHDYFYYPITQIPKWRADILTRIPGYRNELIVVAEKVENI